MKRMITGLIIFVLVIGLQSSTVHATPTTDLKPVLDDLTSLLSNENLKGKEHLAERRAKIMSQIKQGFDFEEMSKRVVGKTWLQLDKKDRVYFTELMTKLLENVYVGKLESYSGESVEFAGETVKGKRAQVTTVINAGDIKIPVHYIMKQDGVKWMVYDINIEGVSLVRNYRQQFKPILRKDKFQGLVKVLEDKNRSFLVETK